jgi:hypothetical protein
MNTKGFTIIESLVAITILVAVVIGASSAVSAGIASYSFSKDQVIAFYLAQEGVEHIRNMRDENGLNGRNWLANITAVNGDPCYFGKTCMVDVISNAIAPCSGGTGSCPVLRQDPVNGFYGYSGVWPATIFKREVTLVSVNANEISILVTVTWSKGTVNRQFRARENILNWQ